ncbi:hypothetical protein [Nocardia colli]|uniref:hypothetical protein n=1 Tax=Nocardia colli TaxID=2545717 RepID=UPI001CC47107|nr:hypothetical protein [Nocardia colli]
MLAFDPQASTNRSNGTDKAFPALTLTEAERSALHGLAGFPLLDAIHGRRSRRFPMGGAIPAGPLTFASKHPPQPLSNLERALVLNTVAGWTGWHFGISHHPAYAPATPNYCGTPTGRTFGSAAGFHTSEFFFTDDSGTYFLPTRDATPSQDYPPSAGATEAQLGQLLSRVVRLSDQRITIPREEPYLEGHNTWIANHPGSLLVIPVADLAQQTLANIAFFTQNGFVLYDDVHGTTIPGVENYRDRLRFADPLPLSFVEQYSLAEASAELMAATHNGHLLLGAMGLGGWSFDGIDRLTMLGASGRPDVPGLGFRYDTDPRWPMPNPTGLPGTFEAYCRPHYPSMADAVDALAERKFGRGGPYHPDTPGPFADNAQVRGSAAPWDKRFRELLTLQATYIDAAFGKFPGTVPSVWIMNYLQAQHIDVEFYDTLLTETAVLATHREHQRIWHD